MGAVPELFRTWPGAVRSGHPSMSLAALGKHAAYLVADHTHDEMYTPLEKLYALDGHVLLLGVGHWNNTSLHLAEFRADYPGKRTHSTGSAMLVEGKREWVTYEVNLEKPEEFGAIGAAFDKAHDITINKINDAEVRFFKQRLVVDFAIGWLERHRDLTDYLDP